MNKGLFFKSVNIILKIESFFNALPIILNSPPKKTVNLLNLTYFTCPTARLLFLIYQGMVKKQGSVRVNV